MTSALKPKMRIVMLAMALEVPSRWLRSLALRIPLALIILAILSAARIDSVLVVGLVAGLIVIFVLMDYRIQLLQDRLEKLQRKLGN